MSNKAFQEKSPVFALMIVDLYKRMTAAKEFIISKQILRSGTSIAANGAEAQAAGSKRDFVAKMILASKECHETVHWLNLIKNANLVYGGVEKELNLALELKRILISIVKTGQENLAREEKEKNKKE